MFAQLAGRAAFLAALFTSPLHAQARDADDPATFVSHPQGLYALTGARVIDGSGAPARQGWTVIIQGERIAAAGPAKRVRVPEQATRLDMSGKTLLPGLVDMHAHLFFEMETPQPSPGLRHQGPLIPRLLLAAGVTTARTAGSVDPLQDLAIARAIKNGKAVGPDLDVTSPYIDQAPGLIFGTRLLTTREQAEGDVAYWAGVGATSFKLYLNAGPEISGAAIRAAHARGFKVAGHLCALTFAEGIELGIDSLEHGFGVMTDFTPGKLPGKCPERFNVIPEPSSPDVTALVRRAVAQKTAITLTPGVSEGLYPDAPPVDPLTLSLLAPGGAERIAKYRSRFATFAPERRVGLKAKLERAWAIDRSFYAAGGLVMLGTDTNFVGDCVAGPCTHRGLELLVEHGFTPIQAMKIASANGAIFLGRDKEIGRIAPGMFADIIVVSGLPDARISEIRRAETVFKRGVGYNPAALYESAKGLIGRWWWRPPNCVPQSLVWFPAPRGGSNAIAVLVQDRSASAPFPRAFGHSAFDHKLTSRTLAQ